MSRTPSFIFKTWALGLTAYALVFTREVPTALAQAPIETDCSTDLDQPDTTYLLNTNVPGNCVIAADNIILDGQNLYTISGNILSTTTATVNFTIQDVVVEGYVMNYGLTVETGNIIVDQATVDGFIMNNSGYYNVGDVTITDSDIGSYVISSSYYAHPGHVTVTGSTVAGSIKSNSDNSNPGVGGVTVTGSIVQGNVHADDSVTISESEMQSYVFAYNTASIANSTVDGYVYGYDGINITEATIDSSGSPFSGNNTLFSYATCEITDSVIINPSQAYCETITLTDTAPSLTVTPLTLELEAGESFNPFSDVSADDVLDGDLSGEIIVVGEVGEGPGTYELVYSVTDNGTTIFDSYDVATTTSGPSTTSVTRTVIRPEEGGTESTRVGQRSSSSSSKDTSEETLTPGAATNMDEVLTQLKTVLAQPINTNDPEVLKKLLNLLLQLMAAIAQLAALKQ